MGVMGLAPPLPRRHSLLAPQSMPLCFGRSLQLFQIRTANCVLRVDPGRAGAHLLGPGILTAALHIRDSAAVAVL